MEHLNNFLCLVEAGRFRRKIIRVWRAFGAFRCKVQRCDVPLGTLSLPAVSRHNKLPLCDRCQLHWSLTREQQSLLAKQ